MESESTSLYLDNNPENSGLANEEVDKSKDDDSSPFDPKMSSREMRKIKYYEDMFARMDSGNKSSTMNDTQTSVTTLSKTRTRSLEKKKSTENKSDKSSSSADGFRQESVESTQIVPSKPGRKSVYKKSVGRPPNNVDNSVAKSNQNQNEVQTTTEDVYSDRKTVLDNKRLIRVQSMPMVTKKPKVPLPPAVEPRHPSESKASRRSKVSRWDMKTSFAAVAAQAASTLNLGQDKGVGRKLDLDKSKAVKEEVPLVDNLKGDTKDLVNLSLDTAAEEVVPDVMPTDTLDKDQKLLGDVEVPVDQQTKEPLLDGEQLLKEGSDEVMESLPPEFETKVEEFYPVEELPYVVPVKKKSNRGRKAKHKRASPVNLYIPEQVLEPDKVLPLNVEDLAPVTPQADYMEELRAPPRGRTKSQRVKKKKTDFYEERVVSRPKYTGKSGKGPGRNHASLDRGDKSHMLTGKRDLADSQEEKFISIENLRMITMEDAEKMLNLCTKENTDLETLRGMINSVCTNSYRPEVEARKTGEKNRFLLDPSNIIAPNLVYNQNTVESPVPENPLHISFKYRLFHDLNKF